MEKYRQPFHNKIPNVDKILDQLKYQQKKISLELQRRRSFVLNPLVDLVFYTPTNANRKGGKIEMKEQD